MNIDIKNFINTAIGNTETREIGSENETDLGDDIVLKKYIGKVELTNLEEEVLARFKVSVDIETICDRCLERFATHNDFRFEREYTFSAEEDKLKIEKDKTIEIFEPIREEIILRLPMKKLCKEDCGGMEKVD
ncbi:hypothetical protein COY62_00015 [bacterium (Candidatus Howlettbacteria) CG_4_10_14_0_8_um_filter_40_9]|nr:MAG: hypothetical protein COY62_00015 [bacterium (Candidatus Howlettbacteria) CG_4_10_14_0_8_um_filter_40_9]